MVLSATSEKQIAAKSRGRGWGRLIAKLLATCCIIELCDGYIRQRHVGREIVDQICVTYQEPATVTLLFMLKCRLAD